MNRWWSRIAIAVGSLGAAATAIPACSSSSNDGDGGADGGACTAGAKECLSASVARACGDNGTWQEAACGAGLACSEGECKADPGNAVCANGAGACLDATTALRCRTSLKGYESVTCPEGTTCQGAGVCVGACAVGSSSCSGNHALATCEDGKSAKATACAAGEACVVTTSPDSPIPTAACKVSECDPTVQAFPTCGNPDAAADQTKSVKQCVATAAGYKWLVTACQGDTSCRYTMTTAGASGTGTNQYSVGCANDCQPGDERCGSDGRSTQVCGKDGKWPTTSTPCSTDPSVAPLVCSVKAGTANKVACVDVACSGGNTGVCEGTKVRTCGADGRLGVATPCASGTCQNAGPTSNGVTPGRCNVECQSGEERCSGTAGYQSCENGRWGTPKACEGNDAGAGLTCRDLVDASGRQSKLCAAECTPGSTECRNGDGGANTAIRRCNAAGRWEADTDCALGTCQTESATRASCVAECIPGQPVCTGVASANGIPSHRGTVSFVVCTDKGRLGTTTTTCAGTTSCRKDRTGRTISAGETACIECVGPALEQGNEEGIVDTRCTTLPADAGGGAASQVCGASNTWTTAVPTSCQGSSCSEATTASGPAYATCYTRSGHTRSESYYRSKGFTCEGPKKYNSRQYGPPVACGVTADCCENQCSRPTPGLPARCN